MSFVLHFYFFLLITGIIHTWGVERIIIYFVFIWATKNTYILTSKLLAEAWTPCQVRISPSRVVSWCAMVLFCYGLFCSCRWSDSFLMTRKLLSGSLLKTPGAVIYIFYLLLTFLNLCLRAATLDPLQGWRLHSAARYKLRSSLGNLAPWVEVEKNTLKYLGAFESCSYL